MKKILFNTLEKFETFTNNRRNRIFIQLSFFLVFGIELLKLLNKLLPFIYIKRFYFSLAETLTIISLLTYCLLAIFLMIYNIKDKENRGRILKVISSYVEDRIEKLNESIIELRDEYKKNKKWLNETTLEFMFHFGSFLFVIAVCVMSVNMVFNLLNLPNSITDIFTDIGMLISLTAAILTSFSLGMNKKMRKDILSFLKPNFLKSEEKGKRISIDALKGPRYIINSQNDYNQIIIKNNKNKALKEFLMMLEKWTPKDYKKENNDNKKRQVEKYYVKQFINKINSNILKRARFVVETEVQLELENGNRFADIIINNNILIEAKSSDSASNKDRARGQIQEYAKAWKHRGNNGPIILLLFDYTAQAAEEFQDTMEKLWKDDCQALTILAKEKK